MRLTTIANTIARMVNGRVRIMKNPKTTARMMDSIKKLCGQRLDGRRRGRTITVLIGGEPPGDCS